MKKTIVTLLVVAVALFAAPSLFAQETVTDIFGIEVGTFVGYNFAPAVEDIGAGQTLAMTFGIGEQSEIAMLFISAGANMPGFSLIRMSYYLMDEVGFRVYAGASPGGGTVASGFGIFSYPVRRSFGDGALTTALGLGLDYLVPDVSGAIEDGVLGVGLNATIAF